MKSRPVRDREVIFASEKTPKVESKNISQLVHNVKKLSLKLKKRKLPTSNFITFEYKTLTKKSFG
jgi:hypothetical protein